MTYQDTAQQIFDELIRDLFNVPIMGNLYRPHYVERMIVAALGEGFALTSSDWAGWDIEYEGRVRIEVKQSAARQTWSGRPSLEGRMTPGSFDIASRTGYYADGGTQWIKKPGRPAHLYIFAWHPVEDEPPIADHRDPAQWVFFVVPTDELPAGQKSIRRSVVERKWPSTSSDNLRTFTLAMIKTFAARSGGSVEAS